MPSLGCSYELRAYVDWNDDGDYADVHETLPEMGAVTYQRGRSKATDEVAAATCTVAVNNRLKVWNRRNTLSPLYGKLLPDRDMKLEVTIDGYGVVRLFTGQTSEITAAYPVGDLSMASIACGDAFERLRLRNVRTALLESRRIDQAMGDVLTAAGDATAQDFNVASVTLDRAWFYRTDVLGALLTLANNSLGGHVFIARDGTITFHDYGARVSAPVHMTIYGGQVLDEAIKREDFVDEIRLLRAGLDVAVGNTVLWSLSPVGRPIYPGATHPGNTWHGEFGTAGKSVITPVAVTDYQVNTEADGSGTDKTAQVTVDSFTSYGGGFSITWENLDAEVVYAMRAEIRGQAVRKSNDERTIEVNALSPVVSGQDFRREFEFLDDAERIEQYGEWLAAVLNSGQSRVPISVTPKDNDQLYRLCTLEFGSRVTLDIVDADLNGDWFVEKIDAAWPNNNAEPPVFKLLLFPSDMVGGNFFRISGVAGAGQDYSVLDGTDRIAY